MLFDFYIMHISTRYMHNAKHYKLKKKLLIGHLQYYEFWSCNMRETFKRNLN